MSENPALGRLTVRCADFLARQRHDGGDHALVGDDGEEARRFTRARRGCGGMRTDPGAATGGGRPGSASAWGMS
ncbi:MAG: hypothetical protein ACLP66_27185, partial [Polyangia bacterium]